LIALLGDGQVNGVLPLGARQGQFQRTAVDLIRRIAGLLGRRRASGKRGCRIGRAYARISPSFLPARKFRRNSNPSKVLRLKQAGFHYAHYARQPLRGCREHAACINAEVFQPRA
jgi:hypothetical protein